jgi:hypothetical protein
VCVASCNNAVHCPNLQPSSLSLRDTFNFQAQSSISFCFSTTQQACRTSSFSPPSTAKLDDFPALVLRVDRLLLLVFHIVVTRKPGVGTTRMMEKAIQAHLTWMQVSVFIAFPLAKPNLLSCSEPRTRTKILMAAVSSPTTVETVERSALPSWYRCLIQIWPEDASAAPRSPSPCIVLFQKSCLRKESTAERDPMSTVHTQSGAYHSRSVGTDKYRLGFQRLSFETATGLLGVYVSETRHGC